MASAIYPKYAQACLDGTAENLSDGLVNIKVVLLNTSGGGTLYTYSSAHQYLSDVILASRVATSPNLTSKTVLNGTFDAADVTITAVSGDTVEALALYVDTGTETTSRLICFIDGLSFLPNGGNANITWNAAGIFSLV